MPERRPPLRALVLLPTRELALQVAEANTWSDGRGPQKAAMIRAAMRLREEGEAATEAALRAAAALLKFGGALVIQTIHPVSLDGPYRSGWKTEDWSGFANLDCEPSPWYFHTLSDWVALLREAGFSLLELREPMGERANRPSSLILLAEPKWRTKNE